MVSWLITGQMAGHIYHHRCNQHGAAQGAEATHPNFPCMCSFCKEPEHVLLYLGLNVWRCQDKLLLKVYVQCTESLNFLGDDLTAKSLQSCAEHSLSLGVFHIQS